MSLSIDERLEEIVSQFHYMATKHRIIEIMTNEHTNVVFTSLDIFDYLRDNGWVDDEEKDRPKQFYLCSISNSHDLACIRDEAAFANRHFKKAFSEGGRAYEDKAVILQSLETVVNFLNEVLVDMYEKGYIKD